VSSCKAAATLAERFLPWCATCAAGLMCAIESADARGAHGADQAGVRRAFAALAVGTQTVRFRPFLNAKSEHLQELLVRVARSLEKL